MMDSLNIFADTMASRWLNKQSSDAEQRPAAVKRYAI